MELPVELTIKGARTELLIGAFLVSLMGAGLAALNSKRATEAANAKKGRAQTLLRYAPLVTGMFAGLTAAMVVYFDDPTFGANRGADLLKLATITFAAASSGLTAAATGTTGARNQLAKRATSGGAES